MHSGRKYDSLYEARGQITAAQKLAEMACERIAARNGRQLPARFWTVPEWKKVFAQQIRFANQLLKLYEPELVIQGFRVATRVWSLGAPFFTEDLQELQRQKETRQSVEEPPLKLDVSTENINEIPRPGRRRGSARKRLNE